MNYESIASVSEEETVRSLRQRLLHMEKEIQEIKSKLPPDQEELLDNNKSSECDCTECIECCTACSLCCLIQSAVYRR